MKIILYILAATIGLFHSVKCEDRHAGSGYIECYRCTSNDVSCGERVTDTMVQIVKCPHTHKCAVFTNQTDTRCNYKIIIGFLSD